ncbi:MAG: potassium transporter TrkA [Candidatus Limnocylindrales bacterium]
MERAPRSERLRYAFDNFMARGTKALILGLFVASIVLIIGIAVLIFLTDQVRGANGEDVDFVRAIWLSLLRTLDPGTMGGDQGQPGFVLAMLTVTLGGLFIVATLIGVLSSGIQTKLDELRKGRSRVIEQDHTVILGWSQQVFTIVAELVTANANKRRACVVILADKDKVEMEDELRSRVGKTGSTRIVCRSGSPIDLDEIDIANVQTSRAIIVLSPETPEPDADVIKTLLAITNDPHRRQAPYHVVAEIHDPRTLEVARMVGREEVELVLVGDLVARITAQTCRQPGLSVVYTELLDFGGDEIYMTEEPGLVGRTFGDALMAYEDSAVIGILSGDVSKLNPSTATVIAAGDRVIAISKDDDTVRLSGRDGPAFDEASIVERQRMPAEPERTLILGWNWRGAAIVRELDHYLAPGSDLMIVSMVDATGAEIDDLRPTVANAELEFQHGDTTDRRVLDSLGVATYQHVIVLSYSELLHTQHADARTLVTLLHLRDIASKSQQRFSMVSEMLDLRNRSLAEVTRADDFIVSDRLVSLYLTQISENKALHALFDDIFDSEGSEIYLRSVGDYVVTGQPVDFYTVTESARRKGEVAIGYRQKARATDAAAGYGVVVNPAKSAAITYEAADHIIVIAED